MLIYSTLSKYLHGFLLVVWQKIFGCTHVKSVILCQIMAFGVITKPVKIKILLSLNLSLSLSLSLYIYIYIYIYIYVCVCVCVCVCENTAFRTKIDIYVLWIKSDFLFYIKWISTDKIIVSILSNDLRKSELSHLDLAVGDTRIS